MDDNENTPDNSGNWPLHQYLDIDGRNYHIIENEGYFIIEQDGIFISVIRNNEDWEVVSGEKLPEGILQKLVDRIESYYE